MIRVTRGTEPPGLARERETELVRVRALAAKGPPRSKDLGDGYKKAHDALWRGQAYKCCYCETREQSKRNDVEHYRPKARADRAPGSMLTHGYWWLAWSWENLYFSCRNCNQSPAKLDKFPLAVGSEPLVAEQTPPGLEQPLLIDPATESGVAHIQFRPEHNSSDEIVRWRPTARNGSDKGRETIRVCMLDRPDLMDLYAFYWTEVVRPRAKAVRQATEGVPGQPLSAAWSDALRLLEPSQSYVGLSFDILDHCFPLATREEYDLSWPGTPP